MDGHVSLTFGSLAVIISTCEIVDPWLCVPAFRRVCYYRDVGKVQCNDAESNTMSEGVVKGHPADNRLVYSSQRSSSFFYSHRLSQAAMDS